LCVVACRLGWDLEWRGHSHWVGLIWWACHWTSSSAGLPDCWLPATRLWRTWHGSHSRL